MHMSASYNKNDRSGNDKHMISENSSNTSHIRIKHFKHWSPAAHGCPDPHQPRGGAVQVRLADDQCAMVLFKASKEDKAQLKDAESVVRAKMDILIPKEKQTLLEINLKRLCVSYLS